MKVDRAHIVHTALALLNEVGIDALSTRLLAQRLGVQQPALYWHFKNKRALLDAMNEEMLVRGHTDRLPEPGEDWRHFVRRNARSFRRALSAYRDGARVHAGTEGNPAQLPQVEAQLRLMVEAGMSVPDAMQLLIAAGRYVVGCVLEEQAEILPDGAPDNPGRGSRLDAAAQAHPLLASALAHYRQSRPEAMFNAGLDLMIDGAAQRLGQRI